MKEIAKREGLTNLSKLGKGELAERIVEVRQEKAGIEIELNPIKKEKLISYLTDNSNKWIDNWTVLRQTGLVFEEQRIIANETPEIEKKYEKVGFRSNLFLKISKEKIIPI